MLHTLVNGRNSSTEAFQGGYVSISRHRFDPKVIPTKIVISLCWTKRRTAVWKVWFCVRICSGNHSGPRSANAAGSAIIALGERQNVLG